MCWAAKYQANRDHYWPAVEQFFGRLPPRLFRQGVLLQNNLATFYADTGQFKDILARERDHPLLYLHFWLLDDWNYPLDSSRSGLEQHLFLAMLFAFAAVYTHENILDPSTNVDNSYLFLEHTLTRQADLHLAHLFPSSSLFWRYQQAFWQEYAEAGVTTADRRVRSLPVGPPTADRRPQRTYRCSTRFANVQPASRTFNVQRSTFNVQPPTFNVHPLAGKLAFTKIPAVAVAMQAGREDLLLDLCAVLDRFNRVFQCMREIVTLRRDLAQHNYTYPILETLQTAGLDPLQPLPAEQILGAMVLTGSIARLCRENLAELETCRTVAQALNLPNFATYLTGIEAWVTEVGELFSVKPKSSNISATHLAGASHLKQPKPLFAPYVDTLPKVIEMAEGYLLSDLTFRESWEVQRRGLFGLAEMTGRAFPMGLIVEILCRHGHDMTGLLNEIFNILQATGFRYYDHPHLPPDTDDLGLLLRLYPASAQPERHRDILQPPLRWLENSLGETGEIPVWLKSPGKVAGEGEYPFLALWGQSCATVEANMLLGLLAYDSDGYRGLIEKSAENWCQRVTAKELSATHHYVPLYALWVGLELVAQLKHQDYRPDKLDQAAQTLRERLTVEVNRSSLTPQDAAFLILAGLSAGNQKSSRVFETLEFYLPEWITLLCKSQRYDGSWADEPLFGTPTRGELATWYSSRTVTTAFCYHALKMYTQCH